MARFDATGTVIPIAFVERSAFVCAVAFVILSFYFPPPVVSPFGDRLVSVAVVAETVFRYLGCALLTMTLLFAPGLCLRRSALANLGSATLVLPGMGLLVGLGLGKWIGIPTLIIDVEIILVVAFFFAVSCRASLLRELRATEKLVLGLVLIVTLLACGRSMYSLGPHGELYQGSVSRTFAIGDRSDSRVPFVVVQMISHGERPYGQMSATLFFPWNFSDRGPLAGVMAASIVAASGASPPIAAPDDPWVPFDRQGFAAYRVAMFSFAAISLFALFGLVAASASERAGLLAVVLAAGSPFFVHEVLFTWPKLLCASFPLCGAYLIVRRRAGVYAGIATGFGYLSHPSALFAIPTELALIFFRGGSRKRGLGTCVGLLSGVFAVVLLWRIGNGAHFRQAYFLSYLTMANGTLSSGVFDWIHERLLSLANTLIPFWLILFSSSDPEINIYGGESATLPGHIDFLYWNTLPFAFGLLYLPFLVRRTLLAARHAMKAFVGLVAVPFILFWIYWGASDTGLMRESMHWWFLSLIAFIAVTTWREPINGAEMLCLVLRVAECAWVLVGSAVMDSRGFSSTEFRLNDVVALGIILLGIVCLGTATYVCAAGRRSKPERLAFPPSTLFELRRPGG